MSDLYENFTPGLEAPAYGAFEITPSDVVQLQQTTRAVFVGSEGDLVVTTAFGQTVTLTAVQPGTIYPIRCTQVRQSGTTAAGLVGLY